MVTHGKVPDQLTRLQRLLLVHGDVGAVRAEINIRGRLGTGLLLGDDPRGHLRKARPATQVQLCLKAKTFGEQRFELGKTLFAAERRRARHQGDFAFFFRLGDDLFEFLRLRELWQKYQYSKYEFQHCDYSF